MKKGSKKEPHRTEDKYDAPNGSKAKKSTKNEQIEKHLRNIYKFRFNVIKCKPEYKEISEKGDFLPVDKYFLNSLKRELDAVGINTSTANIKEILESKFADLVNPIKQYFLDLSKWDGKTDHIKTLCDTVKVRNDKQWSEYLKKWLVAVVANVMVDEKCMNHTCLVLTGEQGKFKTSWLENLCPKLLRNYLYTGKIDPTNKDSLTCLAEFVFINIDDQLRQLNRKDENELKNLITVNNVKYRRPYDPYITEYPHVASFMASVNGNDFLTDPTGSRRFLAFEVLDINISAAQALNMDLIWKQAYALYKSGFQYWFSDKDMEELNANNEAFKVTSLEEELLREYFKPCERKEDATHFYTSSRIKTDIEEFTKQRLNAKKLGEALVKHGFVKWQRTMDKHTQWVWNVVQVSGMEINNNRTNKITEAAASVTKDAEYSQAELPIE